MLKVYISSPVSYYQRKWNNKITNILRANDFKVLLPQEITPKDKYHKSFEIYVYDVCIDMIQESDFGLLLLPYGRDCAWEAGYYKGLNKPFFLFADKLDDAQSERLRDWMVKGGLFEIITANEDTYRNLKKDPILNKKNVHLIKSLDDLPIFLESLFKLKYEKYTETFIGVGAVVVKKNKVLLVQEKKDSDFYYRRKGMWGFPTKILSDIDPKEQSLVSLKKETGLIGYDPKLISIQNIPNAVGLFYEVQVNNYTVTEGKWVNLQQVLNEEVYLRPTYINVLKRFIG